MRRQAVSLAATVIVLVACSVTGAGLRCYACSKTRSVSGVDGANLQCLATGSEVTCGQDEDRCYSRTSGALGDEVDKGCTRSALCLASTVCCSQDFCNAGHSPRLRTGWGQRCQTIEDCVQQEDDMTCLDSAASDGTRCACTDSRFQRGAMCQRKSYEGEDCAMDEHCLLTLSFCQAARCRCPDQFYPNSTLCQLKLPLGANCSFHQQCRSPHTQCQNGRCACQFGFVLGPTGDICSGQSGLVSRLSVLLTMSLLLAFLHPQQGATPLARESL